MTKRTAERAIRDDLARARARLAKSRERAEQLVSRRQLLEREQLEHNAVVASDERIVERLEAAAKALGVQLELESEDGHV